MRSLAPLLLVSLLLGAVACAPPAPDALKALEVESASLSPIGVTVVGLVGGYVEGDATLTVTDTAGVTQDFPIRIEGGLLGAMIELGVSVQDEVFQSTSLELPSSDAPLTGDQLVGLFEGSTAGFELGLGFMRHELENEHGVKVKSESLALGFGVAGALEWAAISVEE